MSCCRQKERPRPSGLDRLFVQPKGNRPVGKPPATLKTVARAEIERILVEAEQHRQARRTPEAAVLLQKALAIQPSHPEANLRLGILLAQAGQRPLGIRHLRTTLASNPNDSEALAWLSSLLSANGEHGEAEKLARKAAVLRPDDPAVHDNLGRILLAKREPEKAMAAFEKAVEKGPEIGPLHIRLGQAFQILGRNAEAADQYRKAFSLMPDDEMAAGMLAQLLSTMGERAEAIEILRRAAFTNPRSFPAQTNLGRILFESERASEAIEPLQRALALDARSAFAHGMLGACLSELGDFSGAIAHFEQAISLDPTMGVAYHDLVESKTITTADAPLIERMLTQLARPKLAPPDRMAIHFACGKAFDDLGKFKEAMEQFDLANTLNRQLALAGRPFDRTAYAALTDEVIGMFPIDSPTTYANANPSDLPILIVGMIRSGTTLVERILASHPRVGAGGEVKFLAAHYDQNPALGLRIPAKSAQIANEYIELLQNLAPGKSRVTDKMPSNYRALGQIHSMLPNARIVHCMRHPVDTCISIYAHLFHNPPEFACDRDNIVFGYQEYQRLIAHWREVLPADRFIEIQYEELVANREPVLRRLLEFCGLEWDEACLAHEKTVGQIRTVSKRQARQPIYTGSVDRWKNYEPYLGPFTQLLALSTILTKK
jgi:tetratricopeptide (TPR) repeat protein